MGENDIKDGTLGPKTIQAIEDFMKKMEEDKKRNHIYEAIIELVRRG